MFVFLPHPVLPRGEGIKDFSPSGRKKEGQISINTFIHRFLWEGFSEGYIKKEVLY